MATINGTGGDDTLKGTADGNEIGGNAGHDSIEGNGGDDSIGAGSGRDTIRGGAGNDGIGGDAGDDSISGGDGIDNIGGGNGDDTIEGDSGNDGIGGDAGNDSISGGDGNDKIGGGDGSDTLRGDDGDDVIGGNDSDDRLFGGEGDDSLFGGNGDDELYGGSGDDLLEGGENSDTLSGGAGRDTIDGGSGQDSIGGGDRGDSISGGDDDDIIYGDTTWLDPSEYASQGGAATKLTIINSSPETIRLHWINESGKEVAYATIAPGGTHTQSTFENHNWVIRGENGNYRQLIEGAPNQTVNYGEFGFDDTIDGGDDEDLIFGELGDDSIDGGEGDDSIDGGANDDIVIGGRGRDSLFGGDGDDIVTGNAGDDALSGGAGDDSLYMGDTSGLGVDDPTDGLRDVARLHAGEGADTAFNFDIANDYIYIGAETRADIKLIQISSSQWLAALPNAAAADILTINFLPGAEPADEADLRTRLITENQYTPPANGQPAEWDLACFTPTSRIATPHGLRRIGSLRISDLVLTADAGPQPVLQVLSKQYDAQLTRDTVALRPVIIDAGLSNQACPNGA